MTKVRFAPSPTGALHIGGARTALYNWLVARGRGGSLVLRIEDTDRERSTEENVAQILDALEWLELDYDEGPVSQFERADRHRDRLEALLESGRAYRDTATADHVRALKEENPGQGYRGEDSDSPEAAIRLRVPDEGETVVDDIIRGEIRFENRALDDPVIARSDGSVLYNFAVAVDDAEMGITDVIRGDDHLSNTPKQLLALEAMEFDAPRYAHLPLLHGPDGKKLSKRHGAASVQELRESGYLPDAVRNYLALLGWGTQDDTTLIPTGELVERFEISRVGRASAVFDEQKLRWINGRYMREQPLDSYERELTAHLDRTDGPAADAFAGATPEQRALACEIVQEKAQTVTEVWPLISFLFTEPERDEKAWKKVMKPRVLEPLRLGLSALADLGRWEADAIESALRELMEAESIGAGKILQPIRVAITGTSISPGIFESLHALGRDRSLSRLQSAVQDLEKQASEPDPGAESAPEGAQG
ncbi:MAG TPA: glutamate--tRNA ligase [Solirubrobacterales bacterium]|nr:glutamate--tRNA ligase [Solirubrobacterales bacterium]